MYFRLSMYLTGRWLTNSTGRCFGIEPVTVPIIQPNYSIGADDTLEDISGSSSNGSSDSEHSYTRNENDTNNVGFKIVRSKKQMKKMKQREKKQLEIANVIGDITDTPAHNLRSKGISKVDQ